MADEHESKIVITGEDKGATNTLKRIVASFAHVMEAVRGVMRTLGLLNWAVNGYHKPAYLAVWKLIRQQEQAGEVQAFVESHSCRF